MSKIIVDQVQKNGGDVLTLPATDATANNQALVGSSTGVLSFSPLALPAADGTANKPVTTDGSGQLQFGAFPLPTSSGTNGQVLQSNGTSATWSDSSAGLPIDTNSNHMIGTVHSDTFRGQHYNAHNWTTSGPNSTWYATQALSSSYVAATWNMFLGDGKPSASGNDYTYVHNSDRNDVRVMEYANNKRVGHYYQDWRNQHNQTSYSGNVFRVLPIRNKSSSAISTNVYGVVSTYSQNNYSGGCIGVYTPTYSSGTNYANVNGGAWSTLASYDSTNSTYQFGAQSISIPAGTTVLVMLVSSVEYKTTYQFISTNMFYSLDSTFTNADIHCDIRMLYALQCARSVNNNSSTASPADLYTACAALFGDQ
tara:strand:+ start:4000 stop:5100 length:1101 start_codon:yes stop_codon:yes gene_type:complete